MTSDKRTRYRAKMGESGLVQANEWVPRDRRPLFKAVAQALRDGVPVTIGEVPRDPAATDAPEVPRDHTDTEAHEVLRDPEPEPEPATVPRDPGPESASGHELPRTVEELLARKGTRKPTVTRDPEIARKAKAAVQARQERYAVAWAASPEKLTLLDMGGKGHEARVTRREYQQMPGGLLDRAPVCVEFVEGLLLKGKTYSTFAYHIWPNVGIRMIKPAGFRVVPAYDIARLRRAVRDLHPDKGGPGGAEFQAAKETLDALLGRS